LTHKLDKI